ncbi:accessory gene regulator ArgB-like protein [Paenibacillus oceani]|uniref:Accessory gene regulator B family protein n=1 Tax=Paenibacillus oceani TaxID=2772510 RepID=A0A927H1F8_9BACL|nr:accessory gene regulator B family protein [Paenibacillus oceani]MBD2864137.1 accessory gene regulator B family protein [Paenibacillus oceani]
MDLIERTANRLAITIKKANPERTSSVEVMKFSLMILLNALATIVLTMAVGLVTGKFWDTMLVLFSFAILRFFSGGIHLRSSDVCVVVSTAVLSIIPHLPLEKYTLVLTIISLILTLLFAPSNIEERLRVGHSKKLLLKLIASAIVASNFFWNSDVLAVCFIAQCTLILPYTKIRR